MIKAFVIHARVSDSKRCFDNLYPFASLVSSLPDLFNAREKRGIQSHVFVQGRIQGGFVGLGRTPLSGYLSNTQHGQ